MSTGRFRQVAIQSDGATYRLELALEKWRPNSVLIFASVFAIGERALERQSWRAKSVNFGFVLANQSLQGLTFSTHTSRTQSRRTLLTCPQASSIAARHPGLSTSAQSVRACAAYRGKRRWQLSSTCWRPPSSEWEMTTMPDRTTLTA